MGHAFSVPLVWVKPKECKIKTDDLVSYYLPDFAKPEEKDIDENIQTTQAESEIKNDIIDQSDIQKKQSDQIDWLNLDEVEFLPSESKLYPKNENKDEEVDDAKLKEKLILSMLTGHLHRYCEEKLKCSVDDLLNEYQRSNPNPEKTQKITEQIRIIGSKDTSPSLEHS